MNRIENLRARAILAAAEFVADQPGGADRLLSRHRRMPDGNCVSCIATPTPWPCLTAVIANLAHRLLATARQPPHRPAAPASEQPPTSTTTGATDATTDHHRHLPAGPERRQQVRQPRTRRHS